MRPHGGGLVIRALIASLAVLLPAGVFAAATVDAGGAGDHQQVLAAGFEQEGIRAGEAPSPPPEAPVVTTTVPVRPPSSTTTVRSPASTVTTVARATTPTTLWPPGPALPTGTAPPLRFPPPGAPPIPTSTIPTGSSWSSAGDGVSVRMHIEPAAPMAGQPVTFVVDELVTQDPCCAVALMFGDSPTFYNLTGGTCQSPTSLTNLSMTHLYAAPGAYEVRLAAATFPCGPIIGDPPHRAIHGVGLHVCVVVGPGQAGAAGCDPAG
jgi:hypothetical protein